MNVEPEIRSYRLGAKHSLNTWTRIYLHGIIAFVVIYAIAYVVTLLVPAFDFVGNRPVAVLLSIMTILLGPPLIGSIVLYGILPLIGKKQAWRGVLSWDDWLLEELSGAKENARIVIINWPSEEIRSMGVLTHTFEPDATGKQMAAVYVPTAPQTKLGYIRIVPLDKIEFTDWELKQWQLYQFTFGSKAPTRLS